LAAGPVFLRVAATSFLKPVNRQAKSTRVGESGNRIRRLTAEEAATALVEAIERNATEIVRPGVFRLLFLLQALMPLTTARAMSRGWKR
jgi:hypothetical protein